MSYFVSMIDTYMSDCGPAEGKFNVLVYECETMADALIVKCIADYGRDEMIRARITDRPDTCGKPLDEVYWSNSGAPTSFLDRWHNGDRWGVPMSIDPFAEDLPSVAHKTGVSGNLGDDALLWVLEAGALVAGIEGSPIEVLEATRSRPGAPRRWPER